jgi:hypothetical protein
MPRKATWLVIIWNSLIALWVISGINAIKDDCRGLTGTELQTCEIGQNVGGGIGLFLIGLIWFVGFMITGIIWLISRPHRRLCPTCGRSVKSGEVVCKRCGFDFRLGQPTPVYPAGPPAGWGQPPQQMPPPGWGQQLPPGQQPPAGPPSGWGDPHRQ